MKKIATLLSTTLSLCLSCTKVDETVFDKYPATDFYNSPQGS